MASNFHHLVDYQHYLIFIESLTFHEQIRATIKVHYL